MNYNKVESETLGYNHPFQTNNKAKYNNQKSMVNIPTVADDQMNDQN